MEVYLDGELLTHEHATLGDALSQAASRAEAMGRVVIEVRGDGVLLDEAALERADAVFEHLALTTAHPRLLVVSTLDDAATALAQVGDEQRATAKMVHQDKLQDAVGRLQAVFETWQMVRDVLERASALLEEDLLRLPIERARGGAIDGATLSVVLLDNLRSVKAALGSDDWSRLADLLRYELCDLAEAGEELLRGLATHVRGSQERRGTVPHEGGVA